MIHFTSDLHFFHKNVLIYCNRPWNNVDEMNAGLIKNWNSKVSPADTVYVLGDLTFGDENKTENILYQLNGDIKIVFGNHDKVVRKSQRLMKRFSQFGDYMELRFKMKDGNENMICMSHFPMIVWNKSHRGTWMLHGHSHGTLTYPMKAKIIDVGTDLQGYYPISIEEVEDKMKLLATEPLDHHGKKQNHRAT